MNEELQKLKEEFEQRIRELEDKYKDDEEWPKDGDDYWVVSTYGEAVGYRWRYYPIDRHALKNNAIFRTEEEAKFEAERLKVLRELERLGRPYNEQLDNWFIYLTFDSEIDCYSINGFRCNYGDYYFSSYDEAYKAIEKIGEDRIKKYLFGLKEGDKND